MAEGILNGKIEKQALNMTADSAGTSNYHIGEAPDKRMQQKAIEHHLNISNQQGRQFCVEDFDNFDYIFAMDESNQFDILKLARNEADTNKIELFLNISQPDMNLIVPDPYYVGEQGMKPAINLLEQ